MVRLIVVEGLQWSHSQSRDKGAILGGQLRPRGASLLVRFGPIVQGPRRF